jgi:hypothetical protein
METAKKNLKLIESSTETSAQQKTSPAPRLDVKTQISKKEKMDIYEVTRRRAPDRDQEEGKPVNKDQLVNKELFMARRRRHPATVKILRI